MIQPTTGRLSYHLSRLLHLGQCEAGVTSDSPRGSRQTTTFKKLPIHAPSRNRKTGRVYWAPGDKDAPHVNPKLETRNPKQIRNPNEENDEKVTRRREEREGSIHSSRSSLLRV